MIQNIKLFFAEIKFLVFSPFFVMLTIMGNGFILLCSYLFYFLEHGKNPKVMYYMDAIWWSFATTTTTGYGDITPVTTSGKILGIALMLIGLALFAMYTALFADAILMNKELFKRNQKK